VAGTKALYRYDGSNWQQEISSEIDGVWASTAAGAWAYFSNYVYHRLGSTWVKLTAPTDCGYGFWGTSESSMWFGSCYFDGSNWTDLLGTSAVRAVTGTAEGGAVGVGTEGRVVSLSKTTATPYPSPTTGGYADIAATGSNNVWMVGNKLDTTNGLASEAVHWDGTSFSVYNQSPPQYFTSVALSPAGALWASGPDPTGTLTTTWQLSNGTFVSPTGAPAGITRMWAAADDAIWAIDGKSAAINVYNGTSWQTASHLLSSSSVKFWALRGSARDDVWVGGTTGMTEHWNGSQWTAYPTPVTDTIVSLWSLDKSHAWAASTAGDVLAWDGTQWTKLTNLNTDVADIHGCSANDNWVINNTKGNPILHHYDGSTWQDSNPGVLYFSNPRIWCASAGDVWLVGPGVLRRQGP